MNFQLKKGDKCLPGQMMHPPPYQITQLYMLECTMAVHNCVLVLFFPAYKSLLGHHQKYHLSYLTFYPSFLAATLQDFFYNLSQIIELEDFISWNSCISYLAVGPVQGFVLYSTGSSRPSTISLSEKKFEI